MIIDKENLFSDDQAITATADSTNVIDLDKAGMGTGEPLYVFAQVTAAFNNLTNLKVEVKTDADAAFSNPTTLQSATPVLADLVAGYQVPLGILTGNVEQFLKLTYTVTGTAPSTGTITSALVKDVQTNTL